MDPVTISIITSSISLIGTFMTGLFVLLDKCTEKKICFEMLLFFLRYGILISEKKI